MIKPTRVENRPIGFEQSFLCEYESSEEMTIKFNIPNTSHTPNYLEKLNLEEDHFKKNPYGGQKKMTIFLYPEVKLVHCILYNRENVEVGKVTAMIAGTGSKSRQTTIHGTLLFPIITYFIDGTFNTHIHAKHFILFLSYSLSVVLLLDFFVAKKIVLVLNLPMKREVGLIPKVIKKALL